MHAFAVRPIRFRADDDTRIRAAAQQCGVNVTAFIRRAAVAATLIPATPQEFIAEIKVSGPPTDAARTEAGDRLALLMQCGRVLAAPAGGRVTYDDTTEAWDLTAWWEFCADDAQADRLREQVALTIQELATQWHTEST